MLQLEFRYDFDKDYKQYDMEGYQIMVGAAFRYKWNQYINDLKKLIWKLEISNLEFAGFLLTHHFGRLGMNNTRSGL